MKYFLYLSAGILLHLSVSAQVTFQKTFDLNQDDEFLACTQTADGGFLFGGYSLGTPYGGIVVKTWNDGTVQWSKTVGGTRITEIAETPSGNIYAAGENTASANTNFYLTKLDASGNQLWQRSFGKSAEPDNFYSMALCPDGGVILSGNSDSTTGSGFLPIGYVVKVDSLGNTEWSRTISGGNGEILYVTKPVSSGGYLSCGYTGSFGSPVGTEAYVVRWDANGNLLWTSVFGHNNRFDRIFDFVEKPGGGFFVTGKALYSSTNDNLFLASLDNAGRVVWHHNYSMYDDVQRLLLLQDGNLAMCGFNIDVNLGLYNQSYLIKTDTTGTVIWGHQFGSGGTVDDRLFGADETNDGGFLLSGSTYGTGILRTSWIVRADSTGNSTCRDSSLNVIRTTLAIAETSGGTVSGASYAANPVYTQFNANMAQQYFCGGPTTVSFFDYAQNDNAERQAAISVYPVPVRDVLNIEANPALYETVTLYDLSGRKVLEVPVTGPLMTIDVTGLSSGTYALELKGNAFVARKIVVE